MSYVRKVFVIVSTLVIAACSSAPDTASSVSGDVTSDGENTDIQLISADASGNITSRMTFDNCAISNKTPIGDDKFQARADCTDAASTAMNVPLINRYVEPLLWIYETFWGESYASRHWCAEARVVVAVKKAALSSPSFREIGFYSYDASIDEGNGGTFVSFAKDDWRLQSQGEARLKNGETVVLFKFGGVGPCEVNGSGDNPGGRLALKPFVTYEGRLRRWEAVSSNHEIGYHERIDRRRDLLQD